jgi:hypothetical protein
LLPFSLLLAATLSITGSAAAGMAQLHPIELLQRRLGAVALEAVGDSPPPATIADPRPVLAMLAVDPVVRALRAERRALAIRDAVARGDVAPSDLTRQDTVVMESAVRTLRALDLEPVEPPALRVYDFRRLRKSLKWPRLKLGGARPPSPAVLASIRAAAAQTGVSAAYLERAARTESSFDPWARASTSSATGLFQFVDQTWLLTVRDHGSKHGLAAEAARIRVDRRGRAYVADQAAEDRILALRFDARLSALLAAELTRDNARQLHAYLRRPPSSGELYVAHFLGPAGAIELMRTADQTPLRAASEVLPSAAAANRSLFYDQGRPRSARALVSVLVRKGSNA